MTLFNRTPYVADSSVITDKDGHKKLLIVVKATFRLPLSGESVQLMDTQVPLFLADTATAEPGKSAPEYECDYVPPKPMCDVLLLGTAYAPKGEPAERVPVGLRVGEMRKIFYVTGQRRWVSRLFGIKPGPATPFKAQPISYDIAFGGAENNPDAGDQRAVFALNPVGIGYQKRMSSALIDGQAMPQTETALEPVTTPNGSYEPMSFGPVGRSWAQRSVYAGTYDEAWQRNRFPFLPPDFDERYFQAAPADQQVPHLTGEEQVSLLNLTHPVLTPSGRVDFTLPHLGLSIICCPKGGRQVPVPACADTLLIEPDRQRLTITWRATIALKRSVGEIDMIEISAPLSPTHGATLFPEGSV